MQLLSTGKLK